MCDCKNKKPVPFYKEFPVSNKATSTEMSKNILVLNSFGEPLQNAHVMNLDTNYKTVTDANGEASIKGYADDQISISHVSSQSEQFSFASLPKSIDLIDNQLDEVFITNKPKTANLKWLGIAAVAIGLGTYYYNKNKKADKKGSQKGLNAPVPVTL